MTADRWRFISKNHTADATQDLLALRGIPVLLTLAGHDINVDTADTRRIYRVLDAGGAMTVKHYPDATPSLLKQSIEQSDLKITLTALFSPRSLFADGFLDRRPAGTQSPPTTAAWAAQRYRRSTHDRLTYKLFLSCTTG
ncbi:hypothetical protein [Streptomyces sp. NPDC058279]|uniref:hypothetical protein n=1 Tax=Streptomyces sp. NPDC058279 TaxID=3346418 RepID=UPI0036EE9324